MTRSFGQSAFTASGQTRQETSRVNGLNVAVERRDAGAEGLNRDGADDRDERDQQRVLDHCLPILVRDRRQPVS